MSDDGITLSVDELTEYCRTQARFLAGRAENLNAEIDELLDEIDEDIGEVRKRLETQSNGPEASAFAPPTPDTDDVSEVAQLEKLETELEEKQAVAEAKRTRMAAFQDLSVGYADLGAELDATADGGQDALERIVQFEQDQDAPAYFDDQRTLLEISADSDS